MTTHSIDFERLFNTGIAAYKQGEYEQAKAALLQLSHCSSQTHRTKAGMGLVRIYMAQQDWPRAKTLCQKISKSSKPAVQQWAQSTLTKIQDKAIQVKPQSKDKPQSRNKPQSNSGLTPSLAAPARQNESGPTVGDVPPAVSMFHYAYLNGELNGEVGESVESESVEEEIVKEESAEFDSPCYELPNAGRLSQGRTLGKMKRTQLRFAQGVGVAAFYGLLLYLICGAIAHLNHALTLLSNILPDFLSSKIVFLPSEYRYWAKALLAVLLGLAIASPWLWDLLLRLSAKRHPFPLQKLREVSPEAASLLNKRCQKQRWPFPTLWKLATPVPLIFSYGWLPRNARLVVSEGLLAQLSADEIATLVRYEMAHWKTFYWPLLSLQGLVLQLFHQLYWQLALLGNQWAHRQPNQRRHKALIWLVGILANLSYVMFWLLQIPGLWLSRVRTYYGDRAATEATGNPNALARALIKLSFGLADSVAIQGYTPALTESLTLLLPVCPDLIRQPLYGSLPLAQLFAWDSLNPLRNWMSVSDAHPPLGDRLRVVMAYAQHWKLELELPLAALPKRRKGLSRSEWTRLIRQGMPFFALAFGLACGLGLLLLGAIGKWLSWPVLDWMHKDTRLLYACALMGLSLGTMLRINRFFPDLSFKMPLTSELTRWISDVSSLPVNSLPAKFSGTLLGRPGLANWLGQDLILKTSEAGLLKLHFFSALGPLGNALSWQPKPAVLVGNPIQVLGWFRRGNRPWLDIDQLRLQNGVLVQAAHPIVSLWIVISTGAIALWLLGFGQIFQETLDKLR
jgi:Zn-dependent protease with chaperone function